jgi:hypothetical protein
MPGFFTDLSVKKFITPAEIPNCRKGALQEYYTGTVFVYGSIS